MFGLVSHGTHAGPRRFRTRTALKTCPACGHRSAVYHHVLRSQPATCQVVIAEHHLVWGERCSCISKAHWR